MGGFGLTAEDARAENNFALRESCQNGHLSVVKYLKEEFGLTKEDAQADDNYALRESGGFGHFAVIKYLKENFGLTREDAIVENCAPLFEAASRGSESIVAYFIEDCKWYTRDEILMVFNSIYATRSYFCYEYLRKYLGLSFQYTY